MKKFCLPLICVIVILLPGLVCAKAQNPRVVFETSLGSIEIELFMDKAPISGKNFLEYVDAGFYNGKIFHRVIKGFMIQGGGFDENMNQAKTRQPIKNEAENGLKNKRGTLAMARTSVVDSATAQFFINLVDNAFLDHKEPTTRGFGYAVFGQVVNGMEVVDDIAGVPTTSTGQYSDVPVSPVTIISARRAETVMDAAP
ncbi:MAG: peptidylprolyl isomerase [Desulfatibacillaceae bacterium]|nr:peptidylprolyl isomerase [Desulfatibacillaceae bacterium]